MGSVESVLNNRCFCETIDTAVHLGAGGRGRWFQFNASEKVRVMAQPRLRTGKRRTDEVEIRFQNSSLHRVVHADGAWGGLTALGNISMGIYSERRGPPAGVIYALESPTLRELSRIPPEPWVRELEVEVVMSVSVARSVVEWLNGYIDLAESARGEAIQSRDNLTSSAEARAEDSS